MKQWKTILEIVKKFDGSIPDPSDELPSDLVKQILEQGHLTLIDPLRTLMIQFKGDRLIQFVATLVDDNTLKESLNLKIPVHPDNLDNEKVCKSTYDADYLEIIWKFAQKFHDEVEMIMGTDTILIVNIGEQITFYLAPRIRS